MFFGNSIFFILVGSIMNNMERINVSKRNTINIIQCSKCYDNFHIFQMSQIH